MTQRNFIKWGLIVGLLAHVTQAADANPARSAVTEADGRVNAGSDALSGVQVERAASQWLPGEPAARGRADGCAGVFCAARATVEDVASL